MSHNRFKNKTKGNEMKKTKKAIISILILMMMSVMFLTGCSSKTGKCDMCGQKEHLTKFEDINHDYWLCDYCKGYAKFWGIDIWDEITKY